MEFAEAKERLKHSWAADRDDFARVKEQLKKKNAEHHIQNGRLSQALKVSSCCLHAAGVSMPAPAGLQREETMAHLLCCSCPMVCNWSMHVQSGSIHVLCKDRTPSARM